MLIGNKWKIESDSLNVILYKKKNRKEKKTGKPYQSWEINGYFATIQGALHELVNQSVRDTHLKDLTKISTAIDKLYADINVLQPYRRLGKAKHGGLVIDPV